MNKINESIKNANYYCKLWEAASGSYFPFPLLEELLNKNNIVFVQFTDYTLANIISIVLYWGDNVLFEEGKIYRTYANSILGMLAQCREELSLHELEYILARNSYIERKGIYARQRDSSNEKVVKPE